MSAISEQDVEIVERVVDAFNRRDVAAIAELVAVDFEWVPAMPATVEGRSYAGRQGIEAYAAEVGEIWQEYHVSPDTFRAGDGRVLMLGWVKAQSVDSPDPVVAPIGENAAAIRNLYGWGVSEQELTSTSGDVKSIGALLEGRAGRVSLQQCEGTTGEMVNTHEPRAIKPVNQ